MYGGVPVRKEHLVGSEVSRTAAIGKYSLYRNWYYAQPRYVWERKAQSDKAELARTTFAMYTADSSGSSVVPVFPADTTGIIQNTAGIDTILRVWYSR